MTKPRVNTFFSAFLLIVFSLATACSNGSETPAGGDADTANNANQDAGPDATLAPATLRVATFNASLYRGSEGELVSELAGGADEQAKQVAEVLQRVRPDVVLVNEFDWDAEGEGAEIFAEEYLAVGQNGADSLEYAHRHVPPTNTGIHTGVDLNNDGDVDSDPGSQTYGDDSYGFGTFPGQYGMVIYSRYPISSDQIRSFQTLLWKDMPDHSMPTDFYSDEAVDVLRLSSKNHVDVPVDVDGHTVHILASHPTPPSFDGPEDRNGRRNHDEIRLWVDYIAGGEQASYLEDDSGTAGGLDADAAFVLLGDLNSDPNDGDSRREALTNLLDSERTEDPRPGSDGAELASERDGQVNTTHEGDPRLDTADFSDGRVGNIRVDYALPSSELTVEDAGVFWPAPDDEHADLARVSDHHLVWVDVTAD